MNESFPHRRGALRIYLGYAAGVGKTYRMLQEARERKDQGLDVVIGYFEPHGRQDTIALTEGIESIPRRKVEYRGTTFEEMDIGAIVRRRPTLCAVDEFAHTNVPGSERAKRWEDVEVLLDVGIDVLTTMNVQHLESLNDRVWDFTGVRVRETVPDWVVRQAAEVVMIDLPPEALVNRLRRGVIYSPDKAKQALQNFFKESTLRVLRELALRQTAHELDVHQLEGGQDVFSQLQEDVSGQRQIDAQPRDRVLIYINSDPSTAMLIRRGRRVADYLGADCFALAVEPESGGRVGAAREQLERHLNFARNLHIETRVVRGGPVAEALVHFARLHQVTQIFLARSQRGAHVPLLGASLVQQVVRLARDMQVTIVAERRQPKM